MSKLGWGVAAAAAGAAVAVVELVSPRPAVAAIRWLFDRDAGSCAREMRLYSTAGPVVDRFGIRYGPAREKTRYDLHRPLGDVVARPTIVWIHGGAWVSGTRSHVTPYVQALAAEGFTTVSVDYTIAPEAGYPTPVRQISDALRHLVANAAELGVDPERIVLAGDSAGAQLASQVAAVVTNSKYAAEVGVTPPLRPGQLRALVLHCGIYDVGAVDDRRGVIAWGFAKALWAYTGSRRGAPEMSTIRAVTERYPATFVSGGDADPLTASQSKPFAQRLGELGVPVSTLFWPEGTGMPHEYQFHAHLPESRDAFEASVTFLRETLSDDRDHPVGG